MKKVNIKFTMLSTVFIIILLIAMTTAYASDEIYSNGVGIKVTDEDKNKGYIVIEGTSSNENIKILAVKDGFKDWYEVNTVDGKFKEKVFLTRGKGTYRISIMIHKVGNTYKYGPKLDVECTADVSKYSVASKHIESDNGDIVKIAEKITMGKTTSLEKAQAVCTWVSKNIKYDYGKYNKFVKDDYELNDFGAVETLKNKMGICYDFSTLTAALGRAAGLEVKVVKGFYIENSTRSEHNWNEFYIPELKKWIKADSTYSSITGGNYFNSEIFETNYIKTGEF